MPDKTDMSGTKDQAGRVGTTAQAGSDNSSDDSIEQRNNGATKVTDSKAASAGGQPKAAKKEESWVETVKTVVYALLIALVIRTVLFQPFNIPSSSMENTLLIGDFLFVEKFAYGYSRFSMPFGQYVPSFGRIFERQPRRGDVIVFKMPNQNSSDYLNDFIKRVVGMPGDRIQMLNGQLYINDKPVPKVRVSDYV